MNPAVLSVTVAQTIPTADPEGNLTAMAAQVDQARAAGSRLIVFPEEAMLAAGDVTESLSEVVETAWPAFLSRLSEFAVAHHLWIIAGGYEPSGGARPFNTIVVLDDRGVVVTSYRKLHLYDAFSYRESDYVVPGSEVPPVVLIDGVAVGLINCYDIRFPELARDLVDRGADLLSVSAAWVRGPRKEDHWATLLRARAIENTCWVVAAGSAAPDCIGLSMIIDPLGVDRATLPPTGTGVISAEASLGVTAQVRDALPALANRRLAMTVTVTAAAADDHPDDAVARIEG